jgi:hypothetical protein
MSLVHVNVHVACKTPCCMSISMLHEISVEMKNWCDILKNISLHFLKNWKIFGQKQQHFT